MRKAHVGAAALGAGMIAGLMSGCGGSTERGSADPVPQEEFSERASNAYCEHIGPCCAQAGYAYDQAACKSGFKKFLDDGLMQSGSRPGVRYDEKAAGDCVQWLGSAACTGSGEAPSSCERVFTGSKPIGATCELSYECDQSNGEVTCEYADGTQGVCTAEVRGKLGDGCNGTCSEDPDGGTDCSGFGPSSGNATCFTNDGLYCNVDTQRCENLVPVGGACGYEGCVDNAFCKEGTCVAKLGAGGSCSWDECADGLYCSNAGVCAALQPTGAPCEYGDECEGYCEEGTCRPSSTLVDESSCTGDWSSN